MTVELVRRFRGLRVLVIGDAMLDTYLEGTASRLCREGPVPVVRKTGEYWVAGGAANTAANLRALEAEVLFLSIIGRDTAGKRLRSVLLEKGVDDRWIVEDESANTLHKLRIQADNQYVVRFDEDAQYHSKEIQEQLLARLEEAFTQSDLVMVSDYGYGTVSDQLIEQIKKLHSFHSCPLLVDSKNLYRFCNVGATVVTPNYQETLLLTEHGQVSETSVSRAGIDVSEVEHVARRLLDMVDAEHAAITLAGDGVFLINRQGKTQHMPTHPVIQANDVGAGDSFAAAMGLALASGGSIEESAQIAIDAASIAITKRRTAVVSYQELLQKVSLRDNARLSPPFAYEAYLSESISRISEQLAGERLLGKTIVFTNGVFDILHAGHVQFLRQAKDLGDVLIVGINSDSSTRRLKGERRPINSERDRMALVAALDPVDYVVLFEEDTPIKLIHALRPDIHVKGGDYTDEFLPEAESVREVGGRVVILPLAGSLSTTNMIRRIISLASEERIEVKQ
jgi:D-beta-D-heptose 7-phosphate kinase / D-beta-D-heptose 1-phosphate adenosyltransferase